MSTAAEQVTEAVAISLHPVDLTIIIVYFVIVLAIGLWIGRNTKGGDDLFLAGRSLGWVAIGFSLFASNISSTTLIGLPGAAWETGISVANYEWMAGVVLMFTAIFVLPVLMRDLMMMLMVMTMLMLLMILMPMRMMMLSFGGGGEGEEEDW